MNPWFVAIPIAYLLGSVPFGYLLVRLLRDQDVRVSGSGNIGATNVARSGGKGLGLLTLVLDLLKGLFAVLIAFALARHFAPWQAEPRALAQAQAFNLGVGAAVAAVLGHVFPVWLSFRGGKGVATALGVFLALIPRATLCLLGVFLVVFLLTRYVSLASIVAAASFPFFGFFFVRHPSPTVIVAFLFIPLLIIVKHHANLRRLLAGTESRFGRSREKAAA